MEVSAAVAQAVVEEVRCLACRRLDQKGGEAAPVVLGLEGHWDHAEAGVADSGFGGLRDQAVAAVEHRSFHFLLVQHLIVVDYSARRTEMNRTKRGRRLA